MHIIYINKFLTKSKRFASVCTYISRYVHFFAIAIGALTSQSHPTANPQKKLHHLNIFMHK